MIASLLKYPIRQTLNWLTSPQTAHSIGEPFFWMMGRQGKGWETDLSQVKRVLVVRLDEIGDVVMTTPFLRELRRNLPDAWITLVVKSAVYNLVELCPYVDKVLTYDWSTRGRFWQLRRHGRALALAWKHLWRRRFDLAILPRWDADHYHGTFVAYFSGAPWRVGYSFQDLEAALRTSQPGRIRFWQAELMRHIKTQSPITIVTWFVRFPLRILRRLLSTPSHTCCEEANRLYSVGITSVG